MNGIIQGESIETVSKSNNKTENKHKKKKQPDQPKKGFQRSVGLGGSHISGGQKQRIAIARAIIRKPQILLMDEATSALDNTKEQIVHSKLDKLMKGKNMIEIAHRLETLKNCDNIYVFNKGTIVQGGKYNKLIKLEGYFYKLEKGL